MKKLIILLIATMLFTTKAIGIKSRNLVGGIEARGGQPQDYDQLNLSLWAMTKHDLK